MSDLATVARPYAKAVFELANKSDDLQRWSDMLAVASEITKDERVQAAIQHPSFSGAELERLYKSIGGERFDNTFLNLVKVLNENRRVAALPALADQYEELRRKAEARIKVTVVSATALDDAQAERMLNALKNRYQQDIVLEREVDPSLVGGAIIYAGDEVIDGTVRGRLQKMTTALKA